MKITGKELTEAYKKDMETADRKYSGKMLEVEAVVNRVLPDEGYVTFKVPSEMGLQTQFPKEVLKKHPEIAPGKTIRFRGRIGMTTDLVVNIDKPELIPAEKDK